MRKIKRVGTWPVGIVGGMRVEMPLVANGKVTGYNAVWKPFRPFPIDMAGFAINATLFLEVPEAKFSRKVQSGFQVGWSLCCLFVIGPRQWVHTLEPRVLLWLV